MHEDDVVKVGNKTYQVRVLTYSPSCNPHDIRVWFDVMIDGEWKHFINPHYVTKTDVKRQVKSYLKRQEGNNDKTSHV